MRVAAYCCLESWGEVVVKNDFWWVVICFYFLTHLVRIFFVKLIYHVIGLIICSN